MRFQEHVSFNSAGVVGYRFLGNRFWLVGSVVFALLLHSAAVRAQKKENSEESVNTTAPVESAADKKASEEEPAPSGGDSTAATEGDVSDDESNSEEEESTDDSPSPSAEQSDDAESGGFQRSGRMEFDERLVKGQAAKSGAVYLFKRTPRRLPGLVPFRRSYRSRIIEPVLGKRELKTPQYSNENAVEEQNGDTQDATPTKKGAQENIASTEAEENDKVSPATDAHKKNGGAKKGKKAGKSRKKSGGNR